MKSVLRFLISYIAIFTSIILCEIEGDSLTSSISIKTIINKNQTLNQMEPFVDTNNNGFWDKEEPFTDKGNGVYDLSLIHI